MNRKQIEFFSSEIPRGEYSIGQLQELLGKAHKRALEDGGSANATPIFNVNYRDSISVDCSRLETDNEYHLRMEAELLIANMMRANRIIKILEYIDEIGMHHVKDKVKALLDS